MENDLYIMEKINCFMWPATLTQVTIVSVSVIFAAEPKALIKEPCFGKHSAQAVVQIRAQLAVSIHHDFKISR